MNWFEGMNADPVDSMAMRTASLFRFLVLAVLAISEPAFANDYLISGAGVKLREKSAQTSKVTKVLSFGAFVSSFDREEALAGVGAETVHVSADRLNGWVAKKFLIPLPPQRRGAHYLQLAKTFSSTSQDSFGNLVELLHFIDEVQFEMADSRQMREIEALRIATLQRSIQLASQAGNKDWQAKHGYPASSTNGNTPTTFRSVRSRTNITTGTMSPIITDVVGNVNIVYGGVDAHKLRVTYWRLKGVAADFLVKGLLTSEWETVLGGQQEILNNSVLNDARSVLNQFSLEPHGDLMYSGQLRENRFLKDIEKFRGNSVAGRDLRVFLGGKQGYSLLFPDKAAALTIAKSDHWPSNYSLFHRCSGDATWPILWKFIGRGELDGYHERINEYIQYINRTDSNISHLQGVQYYADNRRVIDALKSVTRNDMPADFLLAYATTGAHGGWELNFEPREIEVEIAAIENTSTKAISIGELEYSESKFSSLAEYDNATQRISTAANKTIRPLVTGILRPGEKIVIPMRLSFLSNLQLEQCANPSYKGEKIYFPDFLAAYSQVYKTRASMSQNTLPKITPRYTYGTGWKLGSLKIDGVKTALRQANFNGFNLYLSNEKGSCPFLYSRHTGRGLWVSEGHLLLGATSRAQSRKETKDLSGIPSELRFVQQEDEITYIQDAYIEETLADGQVRKHVSDSGLSRFLVTRNHEQILQFSHLSTDKGTTHKISVEGYYIPLASLNFQDDFLLSSPTDERSTSTVKQH